MYKYTAVIIEPREHKALSFVLNNFLTNLSDEWCIIIICGSKNKEYLNNILENDLQKFKERIVKVIQLDVDNLNAHTYNELLKSNTIYHFIDTEMFLIFQTDSMILSENKDLINKFLTYDYVGAPWAQDSKVGNGGLSLRKKSKMLEIISSPAFKGVNEDWYFSQHSPNKPRFEEAKLFSVETTFSPVSFAIHNMWKYLKKEEIDYYINTYKDVATLIALNS